MASTIGAWSYVKNDGSLSTKDDVNSNLSSTGGRLTLKGFSTLSKHIFIYIAICVISFILVSTICYKADFLNLPLTPEF